MRFPRFYLSTLLLICIFAGAVLGTVVMSNPWRFDRFVHDADFDRVLNGLLTDGTRKPRYELPSMDDLFKAQMCSPNGAECARTAADGAGIDVLTKDKKGEYTVLAAQLKNEHKIVWLQFSKDGRNLAAVCDDGIAVFARRPYGWRGFAELPVAWIALVSFIAVLVVFVRAAARKWSRFKSITAPPESPPSRPL